jgi:Skp family chaperone for outer membrane proteins
MYDLLRESLDLLWKGENAMSPRMMLSAMSILLALSASNLAAALPVPTGDGATAKPARAPKPRLPDAESPRPGRAPAKVAVVDIVHVFNEYRRAKDLTKELGAFRDKMKAESEKRAAECKALQERIRALVGGSDEAERLKAELQEKAIAMETWMKAKQAEAMGRHKKLTEEMYEEIVAATGRIARRRGFLVVLNAQHKLGETPNAQALLQQIRGRTVLYADQRVHLCKDVLKEVDEAYRKKQETRKAGKKTDRPPKVEDEF